MKTIYITDPTASDVHDMTMHLSHYLPTDSSFEIDVVSTDPKITLSITYDETALNEETLLHDLHKGEFLIENRSE